jgi:hypothetical protein
MRIWCASLDLHREPGAVTIGRHVQEGISAYVNATRGGAVLNSQAGLA